MSKSQDESATAAKSPRPTKKTVQKSNGPRTEANRPNLRRGLVEHEIYENATRLFAERGFAGTSFQDIADAVGLTRPALYHYVASKDELLARLVVEITEDPAASMQAIARRDDLNPADKVRAITLESVRRQAEHAARFQLLNRSEADLPEGIAAKFDAGRRAVLKALAGVIDEGAANGTFRPVDARVAALGLLGMSNWVAFWYQPGGRNDLETICEQLADMAVASLRDPDGQDPRSDGPQGLLRRVRQDLDRLQDLID